jgi:hypothetical protein
MGDMQAAEDKLKEIAQRSSAVMAEAEGTFEPRNRAFTVFDD